jgi:hypothetical protein
MEAGAARSQSFDHLRENSIGLPQVLFQSITHMAPGAAIAFSILFSVQFAGPALPGFGTIARFAIPKIEATPRPFRT